ncbi:Kel3 protein [Saccharomycopsis crataegensis]|uniref:Kel3 protein n=1 Tax=Saccharomycopsis crataegensis TaxID=43959 RepID=A0AAV5QM35_9ASCO|nr:Kel3 protein [Saccharomycopsis crataegensis]
MAKKKDKKDKDARKARMAAKNEKAKVKSEGKNKKMAKKQGLEEDDQDIDEILKNFQLEQEQFEEVSIEKCEKPTRRNIPAMVANPIHGKRELFLFGGESVNDNGLTVFFNDLYTYSVDSDIWRRIVSKNSPLPRSSHAMCAHPSGIVVLFGGEFSSPKQNTFYHYGDTWILDPEEKKWAKVESKKGPSARSGCRMCVWKGSILLFGGFRDLGTSTTYLNDLWVFDVSSYKWQQVEFPPHHPIPDSRSGHSFVSYASGTDSGAVVWGGYTKVKAGKGLQKGKHLTDSWVLKMKTDLKQVRWERRKKQGFAPSPRAGCSLTQHGSKFRYILFGGVHDTEETEESLSSVFYNNLFVYQGENNKWFNLSIRPQKKKKEKLKTNTRDNREQELEEFLNSILKKNQLNDDENDEENEEVRKHLEQLKLEEEKEEEELAAKEYPVSYQLPHPRFNATTCVIDDTYFIYGGMWEYGEKDINIDSMYSIDLAKLDGVKIYWEDLSEVEKAQQEDEDEDEDDDDFEDDEDDDDDEIKDRVLVAEEEEEEEEEVEEENEMEVPDERPWLPHPKPFETLRNFYLRTGAQFLEWSISSNRDARGKYLKKAAFDLCEDRWWERREQVRISEERMEEMGNVGEVIEKDATQKTKRR